MKKLTYQHNEKKTTLEREAQLHDLNATLP